VALHLLIFHRRETENREFTQKLSTKFNTLQRSLAGRLELRPLPHPPRTIGGADISFNKFSEVVYAGIVVLSFPELRILDRVGIAATAAFPYVPGLLAFRELPALMEVWEQLTEKPDVLVLDGQGIAHPRRMGVATHFGIVAGTPAIGCAKTLLTGKYDEPGEAAGSVSELIARNGDKIGEVLRTKLRTAPVFVSPGNLITQAESTDLLMRCVTKYRIPEPTRQAHLLVNELRLAAGISGVD
jgi:deoxyribonuclease V